MATNNCVLGVSAPGMDTVVKKFTLFKDYYPLSQSSNSATVKADWYDCGYGLVSEKLQRDDYGNANIKGKIALIRLLSRHGGKPPCAHCRSCRYSHQNR